MEVEKLCLESRKVLNLTAVQTVDGFTEQCLKLTINGNKVIISGEGIKISAFNKTTGNLTAEGNFTNIKFGGEKTKFMKRIFK